MTPLELKKLARKGIPAAFRSHIWAQALHLEQIKADSPGRYAQLCSAAADAEAVKAVEKDLDRTFVNHPAFHLSPMLQRLRRVLVAFASHCPHIGYCQSLNFLAGFLLLQFREDDAFWLLVTVCNAVLPPDYFTHSMLGLHTDLAVLSCVLATHLPRLSAHLQALQVDIRPIAFPWLLSVFVKTLPIESALRVWDSFVLEGSKVLFRTALALLSVHEERIVRTHNFGQLYSLISRVGDTQFDCERLMEEGFAMRGISRATLERLRRKERKALLRELEDAKRRQEAKAAANAAAAQPGGGGSAERGGVNAALVLSGSDEEEVQWTEGRGGRVGLPPGEEEPQLQIAQQSGDSRYGRGCRR